MWQDYYTNIKRFVSNLFTATYVFNNKQLTKNRFQIKKQSIFTYHFWNFPTLVPITAHNGFVKRLLKL